MKSGRTCIIADSRHTDRWTNVEPTCCKGDLAFHCNNKEMRSELIEWAKAKDNGNPRCADDVEELQFADVLAGLADFLAVELQALARLPEVDDHAWSTIRRRALTLRAAEHRDFGGVHHSWQSNATRHATRDATRAGPPQVISAFGSCTCMF